MTPLPDPSTSARMWPTKLTPGEREQALLDALASLDRWADVNTIRRLAGLEGVNKVAPGTTRAILDRLADAGRCERQVRGASATFRAGTGTCPRCNGEGNVPRQGWPRGYGFTCPLCGGTGEREGDRDD